MNPRLAAINILLTVVKSGHSLQSVEWPNLPAQDLSFCKALTFGILRQYEYLEALSQKLLQTPLRAKDQDILMALFVGCYQLLFMQVPDYAALDSTVKLTQPLKKPWAKGLLTACLRRLQRQEIKLDPTPWLYFPAWLSDQFKQDWPDQWQMLITESQKAPPLVLRVNLNKTSRENYLNLIEGQIEPIDSAISIQPLPINQLPHFSEGWISVQDGAAQIAPFLLQPKAGHSILDACAAPGGKTGHLLEYQPHLNLTAIEIDPKRMERLTQNCARLHLNVHLKCADACEISDWWDGKFFDGILLDAPCSATGIIRRQPDIKRHRRASDLAALNRLQFKLLQNLWQVLAPSAKLLYITCSLLKQENDDMIQQFLAKEPSARCETLSHPEAIQTRYGIQFFPHGAFDGFYYSLLTKN